MEKFDVIVIGGGASGCYCALNCLSKNVAIIESDEKLAKKLLITGNGRCNITNLNCSKKFYNQDIQEYLSQHTPQDAITFFEELGLTFYVDHENRIYPNSNSAKNIVDIINFHINKNDIKSFCNQKVVAIKPQNEGYFVQTNQDIFFAKKIVVATGTSFLPVLDKLDIKSTKLFPSLVALKTKQKTKRLDGVKVSNCKVTCVCNGKTAGEFGEVLFKSEGLSGICIFDLSCIFARQKTFNGKISINLLPNYTVEALTKILNKNKNIFDTVQNMLCGFLHKEIGIEVAFRNGLDSSYPCKRLSDMQIINIAKTINCLDFDIIDTYANNQVVSGGIKLDELTTHLESKKYKGLYFCGEICDVDGNCGGYNLQWAWTSAYIVSKHIDGIES